MDETGFAGLDTALGRCGIAWGPRGLRGIQIASGGSSHAGFERRWPGLRENTPPPAILAAIEQITSHLSGKRPDYSAVALDFSLVTVWEASVLRAAQAIPFGETRTYGGLAQGLGDPGAAQAVGQALGRNPWPIVVPCHRITASNGKTGGFSAPGGALTKLKLLEIEGALAAEALPLFAARPD